MTTVLVTGATGQVGRDLVDWLDGRVPPGGDEGWQPDGAPIAAGEFTVAAHSHAALDITDVAAVAAALDSHHPAVVVNLAAYTQVDLAEGDAERCDRVNHRAVGQLSAACAERGARLITVSTDYVFDGRKGAAYVEDDPTGPLNVYGRTKRDGELACGPADTIVRTSWVMGQRGRNIARLVAERARAGAPVRFVTDQKGTVTAAADLARALVALVRRPPGGLVHVANRGATTPFEIAQFVATSVGAPASLVTPIVTAELEPTPAARRPPRSDLATERWAALGFAPLPPWRDGLRRVLSDY